MTTVVAKRTKTGVKFAADEQSTWGHRAVPGAQKIFTNGVVTFGVAGAMRDRDILEFVLKVPSQTKADKENPRKWVVSKLIPAIQKALEEGGNLSEFEGQKSSDNHILFSVSGLAGYIDTSFSLCGTEEPFWAIGSGSEYALGALAVGADPKMAVQVASFFDVYTGGNTHTAKAVW